MSTPRKDLEELNKWLKESEVDTRSLILLAKEIAMRCVDDGIVSERINMKSEDGGVSSLTERFPAIAISAFTFIHKVVEDEKKRLEKTPEDRVINFAVVDTLLEDKLC